MSNHVIRRLTLEDEAAFREFERTLLLEKATGNSFVETKKVEDFQAFIAKIYRFEEETDNPDWSRSTNFYYFIDDTLVARIGCRWELDKGDLRTVGGHIGYVTRTDYRGRGLMTRLLDFALDEYAKRQINPVLITALEDNLASRRVIEKAGGQLENTIDLADGKRLARYWIDLSERVGDR